MTLTNEALSKIEKALKRGNTVELKKVNGKLIVVEIGRKKIQEEIFKN